MAKQRLRKDELITLTFQLFWEEAHRLGRSSIQGISIPLDRVRRELAERTGTPRQNSKWIHTQIRKYEEREGVVLFQKTRDAGQNEALAITEELLTFVQKRHLYRSEKIRLANGAADLIEGEIAIPGERTGLFLGAGTTMAILAEVLLSRVETSARQLDITTHNMGVIETLTHPNRCGERIRLFVAPGQFDPVTYALLSDAYDVPEEREFDLIIQGASAVHSGGVYIESAEELPRKRAVIERLHGPKLLVLTLHEFFPDLPDGMRRFGDLAAFDFLVVPRVKRPLENQARGIRMLDSSDSGFRATITGWHYRILTRDGAPVEVPEGI